MKSKDLQQVVLSKWKNGEYSTKVFRDLGGAVSLGTIKRWTDMVKKTGSINLSTPLGPPRTVRTTATIRKVKERLNSKKKISKRILAKELKISDTSVHHILRNDLGYKPYKIIERWFRQNQFRIFFLRIQSFFHLTNSG